MNKKTFAVITLILSIIFFGLGVSFPLLTAEIGASIPRPFSWIPFVQERVTLNYETFNLFDFIGLYFSQERYFAGVLLMFSFFIPLIVYISLIIGTIQNATLKTSQHWIAWSTFDAIILAIFLIRNFQMDINFVTIELRIGVIFIALAVLFRIATIVLMAKNEK